MLRLLNERSFHQFIGDRGVRTLVDARDYIVAGPMASYERFGFGMYLAELKAGGEPIGICGLVKRESLPDADVGFALLPHYWASGYAFEAAAAVIDHAKAAWGLDRVVGITSPENQASIKLLEKLGLAFERTVRLSDERDESLLFGRDLRIPRA